MTSRPLLALKCSRNRAAPKNAKVLMALGEIRMALAWLTVQTDTQWCGQTKKTGRKQNALSSAPLSRNRNRKQNVHQAWVMKLARMSSGCSENLG
jgi:hypothetical protein